MSRAGIWIQGGGEMASGAAIRLLEAGYDIILAETSAPLAVRRRVCFSEAVYEGRAVVAGRTGRLAATAAFVAGEAVVVIDPEGSGLVAARPVAVVDARMTKRAPVALPAAGVPRIGLGPGFSAGRDADLVVETHRPAGPGTLITHGSALENTGVPGEVGGAAADRLLRSPAVGRLQPRCRIGDLVRRGQVVATVAGLPVVSRLDGMLRGLVHERAELFEGVKVGDVDPRGAAVDPAQVTDKALAVGDGVVAALRRLGIAPAGGRRSG